jgi:hypothetical protein
MKLNTAPPTMMNGPKKEGVVRNSQAPYSTSFKLAIYVPERYTQLTSTCYIFLEIHPHQSNKLFSILWIPAIVRVPGVFWHHDEMEAYKGRMSYPTNPQRYRAPTISQPLQSLAHRLVTYLPLLCAISLPSLFCCQLAPLSREDTNVTRE